MLFLILIALFIAILVLHYYMTYSKFSDYGVKHPTAVPIFGTFLKLCLRIENFTTHFNSYYLDFQNERFVGMYELLRPSIVIRDLDLVKTICTKDFEYFLDHRIFFDGSNDPIFSRNLLSLKGQEWKDMRSTLSPAFTNSKLKLMVPFIEEVGEKMISVLKRRIKESENGAVDVDCKKMLFRCANDVMATCAFGLNVDSQTDANNEFLRRGKNIASYAAKQMVYYFLHCVSPAIVEKFNMSLFSKQTENFFINLMTRTMKDRVARNIIRPDLVHLFLKAKKGQLSHDDNDGSENDVNNPNFDFETVEELNVDKKTTSRDWSDMDFIAQAVLLYTGGVETVSTLLFFTLHELSVHPNVQDRLYQEIKENEIKYDGKLDYTAIQNMKYMDMVISEVLRKWPPFAATDRLCAKDYNLGKPNSKATKDYIIRKGEHLWIPISGFHHDPELFPDPDKFDPERFSHEKKHLFNHFAYMPFGMGPRYCIGAKFALCEVKVSLYQLLLHIELSLSVKTRLPEKLCTGSFQLNLEGGHWLTFKLRS